MSRKFCPCCVLFVPVQYFFRAPSRSDGLDSYCRDCRTALRACLRALGHGTDRGYFTGWQWALQRAAFGYRCARCGRKEPYILLVPDHMVPLSRGGSNTIDNIVPLCEQCNREKHMKIIRYMPGHVMGMEPLFVPDAPGSFTLLLSMRHTHVALAETAPRETYPEQMDMEEVLFGPYNQDVPLPGFDLFLRVDSRTAPPEPEEPGPGKLQTASFHKASGDRFNLWIPLS